MDINSACGIHMLIEHLQVLVKCSDKVNTLHGTLCTVIKKQYGTLCECG